MSIIQLRNLRKTYMNGENTVHALRDVTLDVKKGDFVAVVGTSGSGKTTLMNVLGCLDQPSSGTYHLDGVEVTTRSDDELAVIRNAKIGFVFQSFHLLPRTTAIENAVLPFLYSDRDADYAKAKSVLARVGLEDRMDHWPNQLSGGQQQRVAIARALINDPAIILADEPTGALDTNSSEEVLRILRELNSEGATIIMVTHDLAVAKHARRIITMQDGSVVSEECQE